ncbi:MAG: metal-binding protein, partial [Methanosarcinales archaeon]|nr:metal-binding protein [Methanosarcinales archaeon]
MDDNSIKNWEASLKAKLHGAHSTVIGERQGKKVLGIISQHEEVKSIIPSV